MEVSIAPEDAYGELMPELIQVVDIAAFQGVDKIEPGMMFQTQSPAGDVQRITVKGVEGDSVTIDANHPLAGVPLNFAVEIVSVREATDEEKEHGHSH
jgi:FKBP-type peptidyl-prolyl cis-trans isomerase SlyD